MNPSNSTKFIGWFRRCHLYHLVLLVQLLLSGPPVPWTPRFEGFSRRYFTIKSWNLFPEYDKYTYTCLWQIHTNTCKYIQLRIHIKHFLLILCGLDIIRSLRGQEDRKEEGEWLKCGKGKIWKEEDLQKTTADWVSEHLIYGCLIMLRGWYMMCPRMRNKNIANIGHSNTGTI